MSLQIEKLQLLWATTALTYCQRVFGEEGQYDDIALSLSDYLYHYLAILCTVYCWPGLHRSQLGRMAMTVHHVQHLRELSQLRISHNSSNPCVR